MYVPPIKTAPGLCPGCGRCGTCGQPRVARPLYPRPTPWYRPGTTWGDGKIITN